MESDRRLCTIDTPHGGTKNSSVYVRWLPCVNKLTDVYLPSLGVELMHAISSFTFPFIVSCLMKAPLNG